MSDNFNSNFLGTNYSLNKLIGVFQEIATNHGMINSFGQGDVFDINASTVQNYPIFWVQALPSDLHSNLILHKFRFIIADLVNTDISNELQVRSDAIDCLWDIIFLIRDYYDIDIQFPSHATPFTEAYSDRVAGYYADVTLFVPREFGFCDAPYKSCISGSFNYGGLYPGNNGIGCGSCLFTQNTSTVTLIGSGSVCDPLQAVVNISSGSGNGITVNSDGLYAIAGGNINTGSFVTTSSFNSFSSSYHTDSSSFDTRIKNVYTSESNFHNGITGSGVIGNIPVFNGTASITNSLISQDDFGNVIISGSVLLNDDSTGNEIVIESELGIEFSVNDSSWQTGRPALYIVNNNSVFQIGGDNINTADAGVIQFVSTGSNSSLGGAFMTFLTSSNVQLQNINDINDFGSENDSGDFLQIYGSAYISSSLRDSNFSTGSTGQVLSSTPNGIEWVNTGSAAVFNSGSLLTTASFNSYTSSTATTIANVYASESNYTLTSSFNTFSSSYVVDSSSFNSRITSVSSSLVTVSSSYHTDSASFYSKILNVFASESNYTSTSSFNTFSSSYLTDSSSFNSRINSITGSSGGGTISGSGTFNFIPLFSGSTALTSSIISQSNNNTINIAGGIVTTGTLQYGTGSGEAGAIKFVAAAGSQYSNAGGGGGFYHQFMDNNFSTILAKLVSGATYINSKTFIGGNLSPTANLQIASSSTANAALNIISGSAPTSPKNGDIWLDATGSLKLFVGGATKTFTLT